MSINLKLKTLRNIVKLPKSGATESAPLIIMLHGIGSNMHDLFSFADEIDDSFTIVSAEAPLPWGFGGWAWYEIDYSPMDGIAKTNINQYYEALTTVEALIKEINRELKPSEIYILGFSQGAIISYGIALMKPELISGIIAMSGYLLEPLKVKIKSIEQSKQLKYFISHGIYDEVITIDKADDTSEYLSSVGIQHFYKKYNMPHSINRECLNDMLQFLNQQLKTK